MAGAGLVEGWARGNRPPADLTAGEWCEKYVYLPHSAISPRFSLEMMPHLRRPLDAIADNSYSEVCLLLPPGAGKTTLFEALTCYVVAEDPGPMQISGQTDDTAKEWFESRLLPVLEACDPVKPLWPKNRYAKRKTEVLFPHMPLFGGGANLTNLQEKSIRWVLGDEIWRWGPGMMKEARARTHDRWNARCVFVSQGGSEETEWHQAWQDCEQHFFCWRCAECGAFHRPKLKQWEWEAARDANDEFAWPEIYESVRLVCPECEAGYANTPVVRRQVATAARYVAGDGSFVPGHIGFQVSALMLWKIDWGKIVREWIVASEEAKMGNTEPRKQVIQKRLTEFWEERADVPTLAGSGEKYSLKEFAEGEKWEGEDYRFLTVDVQKDWFYAVARAWKFDGSSRLLWRGRLSTWENIPELAGRLGIPNSQVGIDCGYQPDTVAEKRVQLERASGVEPGRVSRQEDRFWRMFKGEDCEGYPIYKKRGQHRVKFIRSFSNYVRNQTQSRIPYKFVKFSNLRAKDQLAALMSGEAAPWDSPADAGKEYLKMMAAEKRVKQGNRWIWKLIKEHLRNEAWDMEAQQVVMAGIFGCLRMEETAD